MNYIQHTVKVATLNCRGLKKSENKKTRQQFIKYIKTLGYDILVLQETHATDITTIEQFNIQFSTKSSLWTPHCGIISINNKFTIQPISEGIDGGRYILAAIHLTQDIDNNNTTLNLLIATILNIYGRSDLHANRSAFYSELLDIPVVKETLQNNYSNNFIMGDFNYSYEDRKADGTLSSAPLCWTQFLEDFYVDLFAEQKQITWKSGNNSGILDYIFCNTLSHHRVTSIAQHFIATVWTDYDMLGFAFQYQDYNGRGTGSWKANPFLARSKKFRVALAKHLEQLTFIKTFTSAQQQWDWIKDEVKLFVKSYQVEDLNWRKKALHKLQKKRNRFLRQVKNRGLHYQFLPTMETQIASLQQSIAEIDILKSGKSWRENGEKSPGYLKRIANSRENTRSITQLRDPQTNEFCYDQASFQMIAKDFYTTLFTPDSIDVGAARTLLRSIPRHLKLLKPQKDELMESISLEDILEESKRTPRRNSPGPDGLPYEILHLVMRFPPYQDLISVVYNKALHKGKFPKSWNESLMTLLYKKGDSADMKNYRPLSLANTDYKLFTRIVNSRIMLVSQDLISRHQLGFIPGRFIAENGLLCQLIMEDAQRKWTTVEQQDDPSFDTLDQDIGLLLDQEKAYDRVNLEYLKMVLQKFGFPRKLITCVYNLMSKNVIKININGHFTAAVPKLRGLKQGDPISPILYNLAFEPFLLSIIADQEYQGYLVGSLRTKVLCYADDALVFVHDRHDLTRLAKYMQLFCSASNAKFNNDKVEAFSVSGRDTWEYWRRSLTQLEIRHLHSVEDDNPLIYLGFPLIQSRIQRINYMAGLVAKLKSVVLLHSTRSLSVVGRATVLNSLILSKLWYILRVTPLTKDDFRRLRSIAIQFLKQSIFPVIPWRVWTLPKAQGGLGVIDIQLQFSALYFRWIQPLLHLDQNAIDNHPVYYLLSHHVRNVNQCQYHRIPLLFPCARTQNLRKLRTGTIDMIYRAVDFFPRSFDQAQISPATALILPLQAAFYVPPSSSWSIPAKVKQMKVSDIFYYDLTLNSLHWKHPRDPELQAWKRAPKTVYRGLTSGNFKFQPYFLPLCRQASVADLHLSFNPFVKCLSINDTQPIANTTVSAKLFRSVFQASQIAPEALRKITSARWKYFWSLSFTVVQRNVIYRLINGCIPNRGYLHYIMPSVFDSPLCPVCNIVADSSSHLLFHCPTKEKDMARSHLRVFVAHHFHIRYQKSLSYP